MTTRLVDPKAQDNIPLLVPYFGKEGKDFRAGIPALKSYLKERHSKIAKVEVRYRNHPVQVPDPAHMALYLAEASLLLHYAKPFTDKIMSNVADDAYKWLKKHFRVKKGRRKRGTG
jgi:hypothetical protein